MAEAVRDGVDFMGYTPWGWIDVVSASTGEMGPLRWFSTPEVFSRLNYEADPQAPSQREGHSFRIQPFQRTDKRLYTGPVVVPVRTEYTGEAFLAVKRNPGKLPAVIIEESWRQAYAPPGGYICKRGIVVGAVKIVDLPCSDQPVLDSPQCRRRSAANHQSPSIQILLRDQV